MFNPFNISTFFILCRTLYFLWTSMFSSTQSHSYMPNLTVKMSFLTVLQIFIKNISKKLGAKAPLEIASVSK